MSVLETITVASVVGYIAVIMAVISNLQKVDKLYLNGTAGALSFWAVHFVMLGEFNSAIFMVIAAARIFISQPYFGSTKVMSLFLAIIAVQAYLFVKTPFDLLPIAAGVIATLANFIYRGVNLRVLIMVCALLMATNALMIGSIPAFIFECLNFAVLGRTAIKLYKTEGQKVNLKAAGA